MGDFSAEEIEILKKIAAGFLNARGGNGGTTNGGSANLQPIPDEKLDNEWADKIISKDPPKYKGPSFVGSRFSAASAEWHDANASFFAWKAQKGREETPVRMNNKGKPWYEADEFNAKLSLAWAARIRSSPSTPATSPAAESSQESVWGDEEPPF